MTKVPENRVGNYNYNNNNAALPSQQKTVLRCVDENGYQKNTGKS